MPTEPLTGTPHVIREPHYDEPLDPERLRLFRDATNQLRLTIEGDRSYLDVKVAYAFPISGRERHVGLLDGRDRCIGMLDALDGLDEASRQLAEVALRQRYFIPDIRRIHSLKEQFGAVYFDVDTDRGRREFVVRGLRDSLEHLGDGRLLIADADGTRYHIPNWLELDATSRRLIEAFI